MPSGTPSSGRTSPAGLSSPPSSNRSLWKPASWKHALSNRPLGLLLVLTLCVAVGLTGCDSGVIAPGAADEPASAGPADAPTDSLELTPMPTGTQLLAPGKPAPKSNSDASAYGCYLASQSYSEQVAFRSKYLHFPEAIVEAADGQTRDVAYRVRLAAEPLPEGDISEAEIPQTSGGVRLARCTIPDVEEAEELAWKQVIEYGEAEAIAQAVEAEQAGAEQEEAKQGQAAASQAPTGKSSGTTCVIREAWTCILGDCRLDTRWVECNSYGSGGGSPPAGQYPDPDEPSPDDPRGGGGSTGEGGSTGGAECSTQQLPEAGSGCEPEEEPVWGKAIKIGRKIKAAIDRGDDLLDVQTWKRIADEEWDELLGCGLDAMDATSGDPVALVGVLDCTADQLLGFSFFDILQGLKIPDRLGGGWYDNVVEQITQSSYFDDLAGQTIGTGHAWGKHADEYAGILNTQEEFVSLIESIVRNPDDMRQLQRGRKAYWDSTTETVVIFDPGHSDFGTAFRPGRGYEYFRDVLQ